MSESVLMPQTVPFLEGTSLLDCTPNAVVIHDMDIRIRCVNRAAEALYGLKTEPGKGCEITMTVPAGQDSAGGST